jgi:hypothetical protein
MLAGADLDHLQPVFLQDEACSDQRRLAVHEDLFHLEAVASDLADLRY